MDELCSRGQRAPEGTRCGNVAKERVRRPRSGLGIRGPQDTHRRGERQRRSLECPAAGAPRGPGRNDAQYHDDGLDSVERSLQTLDAYLDTLKKHLPPTAQCFHELGLESYKEFKKMLCRGEDALVHAYASPANPSASPIADLIQAADEAMAESS